MLASFLYKSISRFAQFVIFRFRADVNKEVEILVLRHQLAVLRRQVGKVRTKPPIGPCSPCCPGYCPARAGRRSS